MRSILIITLASVSLVSCVSKKKLLTEQQRVAELTSANAKLASNLQNCEDSTANLAKKRALLETEIEGLNKQTGYLRENSNQALKQLQDLSVISASQAESIKKSMENIGAKDAYIQDLQTAMARKDSLNMALVMKIKGAVGDINDQDINVKVDKGV